MAIHWCINCGMGESCAGYSKYPHTDCALYIPTRMDGTVNFDLEKIKWLK